MKTVEEVLDNVKSGWVSDETGVCMGLQGEFGLIEIRIEPLLYGGYYLAVYQGGDLVGDKLPITLGTPAQNGVMR